MSKYTLNQRNFSVGFAYFVNSIEKSVVAVSHGDQSDAVEVNLQLVAVNCVVKASLESWDKSDAKPSLRFPPNTATKLRLAFLLNQTFRIFSPSTLGRWS